MTLRFGRLNVQKSVKTSKPHTQLSGAWSYLLNNVNAKAHKLWLKDKVMNYS